MDNNDDYSPIKHFAYFVYLNHNPRERLMVMLNAYFDASGHPKDKNIVALVVGGYVSSVEQWLKFERKWKAILTRYEVSSFHMKDFAHSEGEFSSWKNDEPKRRKFQTELLKVIRLHTRRTFSVSVVMDDYRYIDAKYKFHEQVGKPYPFCGIACMALIERWRKKIKCPHKIKCMIEDGDLDKGGFYDKMKEYDFDPPTSVRKGENVAIEAADWVVWEHLKRIDTARKKVGMVTQRRYSFQRLTGLPGEWESFTMKDMEALCLEHGIPLRGTPQNILDRLRPKIGYKP